MPTRDELMSALRNADAAGDTEGARRIATMMRSAPQQYDPAEGMSAFQRGAANVGAGMMDLVTGGKQLYTDLFGTDAESAAMRAEVDEKRRIDANLAKVAPGGEWAGKALQMSGSIAPTLALPAGAVLRGARALPGATRVLGTAPARFGTAAGVADAALAGGALSAINPLGTDDSRAFNVATGAALGSALPATAATGRGIAGVVTRGGGERRAADMVAKETANQALGQTIAKLNAAKRGNIPLSTAALADDPALARLEAGSRTRNGAEWYPFDQRQAAAVSDEFMKATRGAEDVAQRRVMRGKNWDARWAQAASSPNMVAFDRGIGRLESSLADMMKSPDAANPAVRSMLTAVQDDIARFGDDLDIGHLQQIRANLSGRAKALPQNAYQGAPRDSASTRRVLNEVDSILNSATNGRWQEVVKGYAVESAGLDASKAAGRVRSTYFDDAGRIKGVSADTAGDIPKITEAGLGRAINQGAGPDKKTQLAPEAYRKLEQTLAALRRQNIVQGVKRSATAGGGSNTASDTLAAGYAGDVAADLVGGPAAGFFKRGLDAAKRAAVANRDDALARALQNPDEMIRLLQIKIAAGKPLTATEQTFSNIMRGLAVQGGAQ